MWLVNRIWAYAQILYMVSTAARGCPQGKLATFSIDADETMLKVKSDFRLKKFPKMDSR